MHSCYSSEAVLSGEMEYTRADISYPFPGIEKLELSDP